MSFQEIGLEMGISGERARELFNRAIRKLRERGVKAVARTYIADAESARTYARRVSPKFVGGAKLKRRETGRSRRRSLAKGPLDWSTC